MTKVVVNKWLAVTFRPMSFRDVYWCHYLNEPIVLEYRNGMRYCHACHCNMDSDDDHSFICHIQKEPQNGNEETSS